MDSFSLPRPPFCLDESVGNYVLLLFLHDLAPDCQMTPTPCPTLTEVLNWRIAEHPDPVLHVSCASCMGRSSSPSFGYLSRNGYNVMTLKEVLARLRCSRCRKPPTGIELRESLHCDGQGRCTGWTIVLRLSAASSSEQALP